MHVAYRLRSTLVAAVFCESLRLTHESRKSFASGKITNLMTTSAESLQQICQSLHTLWSAPFRISVAWFFFTCSWALLLFLVHCCLLFCSQYKTLTLAGQLRSVSFSLKNHVFPGF